MGRHLIYRTLSAGACFAGCLLPAAVQGNETEIAYGFSQSFESSDNLGLDPISLGSTTFASTGLTFGLLRETPLDRFGLTASGTLRAVNGPGAESGLDDQRLELSYDREGARSAFGINASYLQSDIEFLRPLEDFENDEGEIELPSDLDDLNGTGTRESYRTGFTLELGQDEPVGAAFSGEYLALRYSDTSNSSLSDNDRSNLDADLFLRFTPLVTGTLGAAYQVYDAEDEEQTRRETNTGYFGLNFEVSPILRLETQLGYTTIDTREFGTVTQTQGPSGLLRLERDMPNGIVSAEIEQIVTEDGDIRNFLAGRSLDLPAGSFAVALGVADTDAGGSDFIGSLDWSQELASGAMSARLDRSLRFDEENGNTLRTALFFDYAHDINSVSAIGLNAGYTISDKTGGKTDIGDFTVSYRHALTRDWGLDLGYRYRLREELEEPRAQSHSVFFTMRRDLVFRP
ncbi:hypothetical protein [Leisingera sp. McT4-56]|uniref:hypothetical protein n=1 Tax=Leisingera sp. McT4-56 TaxID=2881255 RepID=UPI001CF80DF7|nr:hypothetical protein [Leisingera sp. McT4-56]MCB4458562.1 hypothetical protein [Leisingera sp. McT4-56]